MRSGLFGGVELASALAVTDASAQQMSEEMHEYFDGEVAGAWGFASAGVVSLTGAGLGAFAAKDDIYHGAAYPMAVLGLVQLGAGLVLGLRTHGQVVERDRLLHEGDGRAFWTLEAPRMRRVQLQFAALQVVELGLALAGAGLAAYGSRAGERTVSGIGLGLAFEAGAMLVMDHAASYRADRYVDAIQRLAR